MPPLLHMTRTRIDLRPIFRRGVLLAASLGLVLLSGCSKVHQVFSLSGPQSTMVTGGPVAARQWDLFMITVYVTTFIFVIVGGVLAYAQIKFRAKAHSTDAPPPPQGHGNPLVEIGLIVASVGLLVIIAVPTLRDILYTYDVPEDEKGNAMEVVCTAYQWWFRFEYPSEMVQQPAGGESALVVANELVIPVGVPVRVKLRTVDVIHSFWVPKLAGKVDMMPNRPNFLWFKADHPGYFYGQCAEYCGESHAIMRFRVIAVSPAEYVKWLDNQKLPARTLTAQGTADTDVPHVGFASYPLKPGEALSGSPEFDADPLAAWKKQQEPEPAVDKDPALVAKGHQLFADKTCMNCHTIRGHVVMKNGQASPYGGIVGPDLTHVGARSTIAAGVLENTHERMHQWITNPEYFKPGNKMYHGFGGMAGYMVPDADGKMVPNIILNDQEIDALVAYLHSLK